MSSSFPKENCRQFSLDVIREATNNFDESKVLGKGGEGKVYLADIDLHKTTVAVKHLHSNSREFEDEIRIVSEIQHPNLVSLLGYCEESGHKILVYEYMAKGCLSDYVGKKCNIYVSWLQRLKICLGAARGLQHLHTETVDHPKGIIHRDIKPDNILIDENWVGKISDFGMFKLSYTDQAKSTMVTMLKGTAGFYAPEYIRFSSITRKIDVYAFGVVLFQLLCGKMPWDRDGETYIARDDEDLGDWAEQNIDNKIKGEISEDCLKLFTDIIRRSLRESPKERPTMNDVVLNLEKALKFQEPEEEGKLHQDALAGSTVFRPIDPRSYFPTVADEGSYYHVFISYKWETRDSFAIPVHRALEHAGFRTFLEHSGSYGTIEYDAIKNSMCAIVVFSPHYTSSNWCLEELLRIMECVKTSNFSLLPIYCGVEPAEVRRLTGLSRASLEGLRKDYGDKVDQWRAAIGEFSEYKPIIMSWEPKMFVETIVEMVRREFRGFPTKF